MVKGISWVKGNSPSHQDESTRRAEIRAVTYLVSGHGGRLYHRSGRVQVHVGVHRALVVLVRRLGNGRLLAANTPGGGESEASDILYVVLAGDRRAAAVLADEVWN